MGEIWILSYDGTVLIRTNYLKVTEPGMHGQCYVRAMCIDSGEMVPVYMSYDQGRCIAYVKEIYDSMHPVKVEADLDANE